MKKCINMYGEIKKIGKVKLYVLNWYDTIITKLARSEKRDLEDIIDIIKATKLDFHKLKKRYYQIAETALIADYERKVNRKPTTPGETPGACSPFGLGSVFSDPDYSTRLTTGQRPVE